MSIFDFEAYQRAGFGVVRNAVPESLLSALCAQLERADADVRRIDDEEKARNIVFEKDLSDAGRMGFPAGDVGEAPFIIGDLCRYVPLCSSLLRVPAVTETAALALGTKHMAAHFMNATIKHPMFGRAIGWHRDFPNEYLSGTRSTFVRLMICLDGMQERGGATRFLPGTHTISDEDALNEKKAGIRHRHDRYAGCAAECDPGDIVVIHPKIVHGSPVNLSATARRNIVVQVGIQGMALRGVHETITGARLGDATC